MKLRYKALKSFTFSRLAFFQAGGETYNYRAVHKEFVVGSASSHKTYQRTCTGGTSRNSNKMYTGGPFREDMGDSGPWWVAFNDNKDPVTYATSHMTIVVSDSYTARLGGIDRQSPSFSVLCDKIEIELQKVCLFSKGRFC